MELGRRATAEFLGTFWLVLGGCGTAVLATGFHDVGVGFVGISLAFGLTVVTMAYSLGHISGCHLNPAVTVGLCAARRFPARDVLPYIGAQVGGATIAAGILLLIASGSPDYSLTQSGLAENGYGVASPGNYSVVTCFIVELMLTCAFLIVILGATDTRAPAGFAPLAIGLALTLIHLLSIPVTNTSVNPARSTGPALFVGWHAIAQLWLFWLAPMLGALAGAAVYRNFFTDSAARPDVVGEAAGAAASKASTPAPGLSD